MCGVKKLQAPIDSIIFWIFLNVVRAITGTIVFRLAIKTKVKQLFILGMHLVTGFLINLMFILGQIMYVNIVVIIDNSLMLLFVHFTFHKDRKSPIYFLLPTVITLGIINIILGGNVQTLITALIIDNLSRIIVGSWFTSVSGEAYFKVKGKKNVEPWIKFRYILVIGFGICWISAGIVFILTPNSAFVNNIGAVILRILFILVDAFEFTAWVILPQFKTQVNKLFKYEEVSKEAPEEEIMKAFGGGN